LLSAALASQEGSVMGVMEICQAIMMYNRPKTAELVQNELNQGTDISIILNKGLIAPLDEIGKKFSKGEIFVPEMMAAANAMRGGLEILRPLLASAGVKTRGTIVIGTVKGDLHDIGKNIVAMMLEGAGFKVIDLGVDANAETFVSMAKKNEADIAAMSALLTTTMHAMETTVALIKEKCNNLKTMIGGAPITDKFAKEIGADGFSTDAPGAVELARKFIAGQSGR
jgi:5-methyltetrahydrofolate--homocysteine methyltransferase